MDTPPPAHAVTTSVEHKPDDFEAHDDDDFEFPEYRGEVRPRKPWVAVLYTLLAPGLGYVYLGRFMTGVLVNTLFVLSVTLFIMAWTQLKFFPLWPALVLAVGWVVFDGLIIANVLHRIRHDGPYILRTLNHPVVYGAVLLFTFHVPFAVTLNLATGHIWTTVWVGDETMYPNLVAGDYVMVDRTAYLRTLPRHGDLVLVTLDEDEERLIFGRIVAGYGDDIQIEEGVPIVNGVELTHYAFGEPDQLDDVPSPRTGTPHTAIQLIAEVPYERNAEGDRPEPGVEPRQWYVIALPKAARPSFLPLKLEREQLLVLNDNRTLPLATPERPFELDDTYQIQRPQIIGRPLFVLLSHGDDEGWRWSRIGLRLR